MKVPRGYLREKVVNNQGQTTVEVALVMPLLLLIFFGVIYFGQGALYAQRIGVATWHSTQRALRGDAIDSEDWRLRMESMYQLPGLEISRLSEPAPSSSSGLYDAISDATSGVLNIVGDMAGAELSLAYSSGNMPSLGSTTLMGRRLVDGAQWTKEELEGDVVIIGWEMVAAGHSTSALKKVKP